MAAARQSGSTSVRRGVEQAVRGATLISCLCVSTAWTRAASPDPATLLELELDELMQVTIVTASRHPQRSQDAPASVTVITAEDIVAFGWRTLAEALRTVPGVHVTDDRNYLALGVRGFAVPGDYSNRVLVLVDGHRQNEPIYHSPDFQQTFPVPIDLVDRIEIVRGPGSTLYGSDALFAVINVITRDGSGDPATTIRALGGGGRTWELAGMHAGEHGPWKIAAGLSVTESEGDSVVRSPGLSPVRDADGLSAIQAFARATRGHFTLTVAASSRSKDIPTASYGTVPLRGSWTIDERSFIQARWERTVGKGATLSLRGSLDSYAYSGHYLYDVSDEQDLSDLDEWRDSSDSTWARGEVDYRTALGARFDLAIGADYEHAFSLEQQAWDTTDAMLLDRDDPLSTWGVHAHGEIHLGANADLVLGAKWSDLGPSGGAVNHRLGVILRPATRTTVKLLHGTAFRAPTPYEMFYFSEDVIGGAKLDGEMVATSEIAVVQDLRHGLQVTAAVFHERLDDLIRPVPVDEAVLRFKNTGGVDARGLEWSLDGKWTSGWRLRLSGAIQQVEDEKGARLANSPAAVASAGVVMPLTRKLASTLAIETQWLGSRPTLAGARTGASLLTSLHWRHEGAFGVDGLGVTGTVTNLFDERAPVAAGPEHVQDTIPSANRRVTVGLAWRF